MSDAPFEQEHLRLVSGYNDIFAGIACIITFVSLITLIDIKYLDHVLLLASAFGLAWYFVRYQRMRFTGIVIAISVAMSGMALGVSFFIVGAGSTVASESVLPIQQINNAEDAIVWLTLSPVIVSLLTSAILSLGFWRFARVPLAHALAIFAVLLSILVFTLSFQFHDLFIEEPIDGLAISTATESWDQLEELRAFPVLLTSFILGCLAEAYAIWWDIRDPHRKRVATDVAFWTHIVAAPFIVQPLYWWAEDLAWGPVSEVVFSVALFVLILFFALVINRRALLIGAMVWVLAALFTVADMAIAGLTMGIILLLIAGAWNKTRQLIEPVLPAFVQHRFPTLTAES